MNPEVEPSPAQPQSPPTLPIPNSTSPAVTSPWENALQGIQVNRFFTTLGKSLSGDSQFFSCLPDSPTTFRTHLYGLLVLTIGLTLNFLGSYFSYHILKFLSASKTSGSELPVFIQRSLADIEKLGSNGVFFLTSALLSPLLAMVVLRVSILLFVMGYALYFPQGSIPPRQKISRIVIYSYSPWLFYLIPPLALIWTIVVQYRALRAGIDLPRITSIVLAGFNVVLLHLLVIIWIDLHLLLFH